MVIKTKLHNTASKEFILHSLSVNGDSIYSIFLLSLDITCTVSLTYL